MKEKENRFKIIAWVIVLTGYGLGLYFLGQNAGYQKAKTEMQAQINLDKKILENHAKKIDSIRNEPAIDAVRRFRKNFGTDSTGNNIGNKKGE